MLAKYCLLSLELIRARGCVGVCVCAYLCANACMHVQTHRFVLGPVCARYVCIVFYHVCLRGHAAVIVYVFGKKCVGLCVGVREHVPLAMNGSLHRA